MSNPNKVPTQNPLSEPSSTQSLQQSSESELIPTVPEDESINKQSLLNEESARIRTKELNGPKGLEPTRYGDWEANGRCYDF